MGFQGNLAWKGGIDEHYEHRLLAQNLLMLAPNGSAKVWRTVDGAKLLEKISEDVGGQQKAAVLEILNRRGVEPLEKLNLIRALLLLS